MEITDNRCQLAERQEKSSEIAALFCAFLQQWKVPQGLSGQCSLPHNPSQAFERDIGYKSLSKAYAI